MIILVCFFERKILFFYLQICFFVNSDDVSVSSNNSNENSSDFIEHQHSPIVPATPGSSTGSTIAAVPDALDNINNYSITTEINDSGKKKILF